MNRHVHILDSSSQPRFGLKGAGAAAWLQQQQIAVPAAANNWLSNPRYWVLRLGRHEYLFEPGDGIPPAEVAGPFTMPEVYAVPRADAVFTLTGNGCDDLLAEICALDIDALFKAEPQAVLMTSIAGISAVLIRQTLGGQTLGEEIKGEQTAAGHTAYKIWCDASYHHYLHSTLTAVAQDIATTD